jgi:hypothetical protein
MLTLSIKEACHEQWKDMTPVEQGAYCGSCCRQVVDFTAFTDQELLDYMYQKKGQTVAVNSGMIN